MRRANIAALVAAVGSAAFLLRSGQRPSWLLLAIMMVWVVAPFAALLLAETVSKRWPSPVRTTLYSLMLLLAVGSLIAYAVDAWRPGKAQAAFVFVMAPLVSWVVIAITVPIAALVARRQSRQGVEADIIDSASPSDVGGRNP